MGNDGMSNIGREEIETRVCARCHFHIGPWREKCQCGGESVRVLYIRADLHQGAVDRIRELEKALDLAASDLRSEGHYEASKRAFAPLETERGAIDAC